MYLQRLSFIVRHSCSNELRRLFKAELDRHHLDYRLLIPKSGLNERLSVEIRFNLLADYEAFWQRWSTETEAKEFVKQLDILRSTGGENELWRIIDPLPEKTDKSQINRETMKARPGCSDALIAVCLEERKAEPNIDIVRHLELLQIEFGEVDLLEVDFPFDTQEVSDQSWSEWSSYPRAKQFLAKLQELTVPEGTYSYWNVV